MFNWIKNIFAMNFRFKNIRGHIFSTSLGILVIIVACMFFIWREKATWEEITSFLVPVLGLFLYGKEKQEENLRQ